MQFGFSENTIKELLSYLLKDGNGWHITRNFMYKSLRDRLREFDDPAKTCLAISRSGFFGKILGLNSCKYVEADYPEHNIIDLQFPNNSFDFCISDQVFEHIEGDPFIAFRETARVTRPGGFLCHTTCFIQEVHGVPKDFWRFTTGALEIMSRASGCTVIESGSWGNREAWALIHAGFRTAKIPEDPSHPLYKLAMRNEPLWPIVTWIVAQKPPA